MKQVVIAAALSTFFVSSNGFSFTEATTIPKSTQGQEEGGAAEGFSATPSLVTDSDIILLPSLEASFEDVWLHWSSKDDGDKHRYWKHRFSSSISLNGEIDPDNNEDLVQKYMSNGGNVNVDVKLGITAFGATHDGFSAYLFGEYAYLNTKEFTSTTETSSLNLETALYGLGLGVKFIDQFYLGWEGGRSTVLGNEDPSGAFYQSVDNQILKRLVGIWALDKATGEGPATYIQFYRAWGAKDVDAEIGIAFSKTFDIDG